MEDNKSSKINFFLGFFAGLAVISVFGFFILLGVVFANSSDSPAAQADEPTQPVAVTDDEPKVLPVRAISDDDHVLGGPNADVELIIYDDFECPYCLRHEDTLKKIRAEYGDKVAIAYRHFPLSFHPEAQKAAEASECAAEQDKFWEMHDKIFAANANDTMGVDQWKADAKAIGLNTSKFNDCLDSGKYASEVAKDLNEGVSFGVTGTPGNFLNGQLVSGAVPFEQFKAAIDAILAQ